MKVTVIVHPNARKPRIEKDLLGTLHIYVPEPPLGGKANHAVITALAEYFNVKKNKVFLMSGEKSKNKILEISK